MTEPSPAVGQWDSHYAAVKEREPYGQSMTYMSAAAFVEGLDSMEDWGCGKGWLKTCMERPEIYIGVDGSASPFADEVDDLATRQTSVEGIVLRHVLEHCDNWQDVLDNALRSATKRLCIVLFTPLAEKTHVLKREPDYGDVPVISFKLSDICDRLMMHGGTAGTTKWFIETVDSGCAYGEETVIRVLFA
jgi:hypothetical protein